MLKNKNFPNLEEYKKSFKTIRFQTKYSLDAIIEEMYDIRMELFRIKCK